MLSVRPGSKPRGRHEKNRTGSHQTIQSMPYPGVSLKPASELAWGGGQSHPAPFEAGVSMLVRAPSEFLESEAPKKKQGQRGAPPATATATPPHRGLEPSYCLAPRPGARVRHGHVQLHFSARPPASPIHRPENSVQSGHTFRAPHVHHALPRSQGRHYILDLGRVRGACRRVARCVNGTAAIRTPIVARRRPLR